MSKKTDEMKAALAKNPLGRAAMASGHLVVMGVCDATPEPQPAKTPKEVREALRGAMSAIEYALQAHPRAEQRFEDAYKAAKAEERAHREFDETYPLSVAVCAQYWVLRRVWQPHVIGSALEALELPHYALLASAVGQQLRRAGVMPGQNVAAWVDPIEHLASDEHAAREGVQR